MWQDVDAMWEADTAAEWERINDTAEPDEDVLESLQNAQDAIDNGCDWLADAIGNMEGDPMSYRLQSILDSVVSLAEELEKMRGRYERGVE